MPLQAHALNLPNGDDLSRYDAGQVAGVAAKAFARIADAWRLNGQMAAELMAVSPRTWARIKAGQWSGRLSRDQLLRVSAATGLYKALHLYFADTLADRWVALPNTGPLFGGRAPVDAMVDGGLPAMMDIRNYVDALRGGA